MRGQGPRGGMRAPSPPFPQKPKTKTEVTLVAIAGAGGTGGVRGADATQTSQRPARADEPQPGRGGGGEACFAPSAQEGQGAQLLPRAAVTPQTRTAVWCNIPLGRGDPTETPAERAAHRRRPLPARWVGGEGDRLL